MQWINKQKILLLLLIIGAFLRFYNLNWGSPFYFHPDERNIADLVLKMSLIKPASLLEGTFAYGTFPTILTLFLKPLFVPFFNFFKIIDPFAQAIIILRFISASLSVLMILLVFVIARNLIPKQSPKNQNAQQRLPRFARNDLAGLVAAALTTFSTGFIQQAHFGTFDGWIALFSACVFYFCLRYAKTKNVNYFYTSLFFLAIGSAAKITLLVLAIFPVILLLSNLKLKKKKFAKTILHLLIGGVILIALTFLLSPYYITSDFKNALIYEKNLVAGTIPVFYTQSFLGTTPVVFQFLHIYPFLINPLLTIIFVPSFLYIIYKGIKNKNVPFLVLASFFLILFSPQAFLLAKWTRYMLPTLPFIYLIIAIAFADIIAMSNAMKQSLKILPHSKFSLSKVEGLAMTVLIFVSILFSVSYFITAFVKPDTRIAAADFAKENFPHNAKILSEPYDLGITPFNPSFQNISFFGFYDLDSPNSNLEGELQSVLQNSDYIILPSQRLLRSRILNPKDFPKGHGFYSLLLNEAAGFQKIYETPCDLFCKIEYTGDPTYQFEETATVFDRPTVFIFKKIK